MQKKNETVTRRNIKIKMEFWWKKKGKAKGPRRNDGNGVRGKEIVNLLEESKG